MCCRGSSATCSRPAPNCATGPVARALPQVTLREMLLAFRDVATRAQMFAHHHVQREPLSVRERMSNVLAALEQGGIRRFRAAVHAPRKGAWA